MGKKIPLLYWKAFEMLKKKGLDDESLASQYRINRREAAEVRKDIEFWFGENPVKSNGKKLRKKKGVK